MSKIKNGGLDQYGAGPFEQQQFGTAGVEGVNSDQTALQQLQKLSIAVVLLTFLRPIHRLKVKGQGRETKGGEGKEGERKEGEGRPLALTQITGSASDFVHCAIWKT